MLNSLLNTWLPLHGIEKIFPNPVRICFQTATYIKIEEQRKIDTYLWLVLSATCLSPFRTYRKQLYKGCRRIWKRLLYLSWGKCAPLKCKRLSDINSMWKTILPLDTRYGFTYIGWSWKDRRCSSWGCILVGRLPHQCCWPRTQWCLPPCC